MKVVSLRIIKWTLLTSTLSKLTLTRRSKSKPSIRITNLLSTSSPLSRAKAWKRRKRSSPRIFIYRSNPSTSTSRTTWAIAPLLEIMPWDKKLRKSLQFQRIVFRKKMNRFKKKSKKSRRFPSRRKWIKSMIILKPRKLTKAWASLNTKFSKTKMIN